MSRPKNPNAEDYVVVGVRMLKSKKEVYKKLAAKNGRFLSQDILYRYEKAIETEKSEKII